MRDLLLFIILLGGIPLYLLNPFYGILAFHLVSIMNPHRYTWGAAYNFPFAMYIAVATLLGFFCWRRSRTPLPRERETYILLALWGVFLVSAMNSLVSELSMEELTRTSKILAMTFVTMALCCHRDRLRYLFWVIALSLGFIGIKSGIFGIITGGGCKVWGPANTFLGDNNDVGMAFNMGLPIIYHLALHEEKPSIRKMMMLMFFLTVLATVLTFSRGAAVALAIILVAICLISKRRLRNLGVLAVLGVFLSFFITDKWMERMSSMDAVGEDASFMGRVNAWYSAWNMAVDHPLTGGGLAATQSKVVFRTYAPDPENFHAAHSIYFQMLGENGFPGLFLFLFLLGSIFFSLNRIRRELAGCPDQQWLSQYALTIQLSLLAYMINGVTLGRAYFDLTYLIIAMGIMTKVLARGVLRDKTSSIWDRSGSGMESGLDFCRENKVS